MWRYTYRYILYIRYISIVDFANSFVTAAGANKFYINLFLVGLDYFRSKLVGELFLYTIYSILR